VVGGGVGGGGWGVWGGGGFVVGGWWGGCVVVVGGGGPGLFVTDPPDSTAVRPGESFFSLSRPQLVFGFYISPQAFPFCVRGPPSPLAASTVADTGPFLTGSSFVIVVLSSKHVHLVPPPPPGGVLELPSFFPPRTAIVNLDPRPCDRV